MGIPVVVVPSGGIPVTQSTNGYGTPIDIAANGYGTAVTYVASGGLPVVQGGGGAPPVVNYVLDYDVPSANYKLNGTSLGAIANAITVTRSGTNATDLLASDPAGTAFNTYSANAPRIKNGGLLAETQNVQSSAAPLVPVNETITLGSTGAYVVWVNGTGSVTVAAGTAVGTGFGVATQGNPLFINITTIGTITTTISGTVNEIQVEKSVMPTSLITTGTRTFENIKVASTPSAAITFPCTVLMEFDLPQKNQKISSGRTLFTLYADANNYIQGNLVLQSLGPTVSMTGKVGGSTILNLTNIVGYISASGRYRAAFRLESGNFSYQASGNPAAAKDTTAFTYPTIASAFIANFGGTSAHLNGMVRKFIVAPSMTDSDITTWLQGLDRSKFVGCWGDSLTAASAGVADPATQSYPSIMQGLFSPTPQIFNGGIGGQDAGQISARQLVDTQYIDGINVFWVGRNNALDQAMTMTSLANMVAHQRSGKFVVMTITTHTNGDEDTGSIGDAIRAQNAAIKAAYPNNVIDILTLMIAASGGSGHIDPSWGAGGADTTHFNATGYAFIGNTVHDYIAAKGWL